MGLIDYARIARRRWMLIASVALVITLGAIFYASSAVATYTASSRLYISMATGTSVSDAYQGNLASQQRVTSYVSLVSSETVSSNVINDLNLNLTTSQLQSMITASFTPGTALIEIAVTDSTPEGAQSINEAVVRSFQQLVQQIETTETGAAPAAKLTVIDAAQTPVAAGGGGVAKTALIGLIAGLGLGCAGAYLRDRLDGTVRNADQLAEATELPLLGSFSGKATHDDARRLAVRLKFTDDRMETRSIVTTSVTRKSTRSIALDLANAFADMGSTVAVIDADVRGVGISTDIGSTSATGLADLLRSPSDLALPNLVHTDKASIGILPIGHIDDATGDLLASQRLTEIIAELRTTHDYVIVDCPTRAGSSDSLPMAALCDGVVIAVEMAATTGKTLRATIDSFAQVGSTVIGTVALPKSSRSSSRPVRKQATTTASPKSAVTRPPAATPFTPTPPPAQTPQPLPAALRQDPAEIVAPVDYSQVDVTPQHNYDEPPRVFEEPTNTHEDRPRIYEEPEEPAPRTYYSQGQSSPPRENYRARRDYTANSDRRSSDQASGAEHPTVDRPTMTPPPERTVRQPLRPPRERYPASDFPTIEVRRAVTPIESGKAFSNVPGLDKSSNGRKSNGVGRTDDAREVQSDDVSTGIIALPADASSSEGKRNRIDIGDDVVKLDDAAQKDDNTDQESYEDDPAGKVSTGTSDADVAAVDQDGHAADAEDTGDVEAEAPTVHLRKINAEDIGTNATASVGSPSARGGKSGNGPSWRKQYSRDKK